MRVLVACEFSGIVRDAFKERGHDAWSCDLLPTERPGNHLQGNVLDYLGDSWDLMIAHPPCTYLTIAAEWAYKPGPYHQKIKPTTLVVQDRLLAREEAILFVEKLWDAPIKKIAIENPVGVLSTQSCLGKPSQIIQPYQFGENAKKATCLWLKGLPLLMPTEHIEQRIVNGKSVWGNQTNSGQNKLTPSEDRGKLRSVTYTGIAKAMAEQWG